MNMTTEMNPMLRHAVRMALLGAGAFAASAIQSPLAQAQTPPPKAAAEPELQEVVVTGSRIAAPNLDAISPVTAITAEEIKTTGVTRIEDLVNSLPQVVADQGSGISMGSNGTATLNLRGLGSQRTLVLVDGRRMNPGGAGGVTATVPFRISTVPCSLLITRLGPLLPMEPLALAWLSLLLICSSLKSLEISPPRERASILTAVFGGIVTCTSPLWFSI